MEIDTNNRLIVIGGPTASGKSACALDVAKEFSGVVINADSMQVYDVLNVLTARPSNDDLAQAPHALYGVLPPSEACSAGRWQEMAVAAIKDAWAQGKLPVVCGGTGLYIRTLIEGIGAFPEVPDEIRERAMARLEEVGNQAFHQEVAQRDPVIAERLHPSDSQRLIRAWEIFEATGKPLSQWQAEVRPEPPLPGLKSATIVLLPDRADLYPACEARFDLMLEQGALDEIRQLDAMNLSADLPAMKALGVPEMLSYIRGEKSLDEARDWAKTTTRRFAKRQMTWFRNQVKPDLPVSAQYSKRFADEIFSFIRQFLLTP